MQKIKRTAAKRNGRGIFSRLLFWIVFGAAGIALGYLAAFFFAHLFR